MHTRSKARRSIGLLLAALVASLSIAAGSSQAGAAPPDTTARAAASANWIHGFYRTAGECYQAGWSGRVVGLWNSYSCGYISNWPYPGGFWALFVSR